MKVIKRTGEAEDFNIRKVNDAVGKAMLETELGVDDEIIHEIGLKVEALVESGVNKIEDIQDLIEIELMSTRPDVARQYVVYRNERAKLRKQGWTMTDLQQSIFDNKYRFQGESFEEYLERVSGGNPRIKKLIRDKKFSFAGRINANRGLHKHGLKVTYSNCYVLPRPEDNIESIWDTARDMARTYSYGGGVGVSINKLRPANAKVHNNARSTSGAPSFMPLYSLTTETIGQEGRRGALMISMRSSHPDVQYFIDIKTKEGSVTGANVSLEIDNAFMIAVKEDKPYRLYFNVEDTGEVIEKEVNAKELYERIIVNNLDWAEPGMLYWDRISTYHFMSKHPDFEFHGVNPCAEEPLPPGGSCLLGSINLSEFVIAPFTTRATFDFNGFKDAVRDAVIALNEVLDEGLPLHPLQVQRDTVGQLRQIGLGYMGIADMLIKMGIKYGEVKSLMLSEVIAHMGLNEAVLASADYAKEHGVFGWYDYDIISDSTFFQENLRPDVKEYVKKHGMANSQLMCIAPTGSIGTMYGISGGIEPIFANHYNRTTKTLHDTDVTYKVYTDIVKEYLEVTGTDPENLPDYFVESHNLEWRKRIDMQAVWQKYIDASISSTINLHNSTTADEAMDLYMYAWEMGLKGCTIYRDGCKRSGILTLDEPKEDVVASEEDTIELERATGYYSKCPECESPNMVVANGCVTCQECGFSPC